MTTLPRRFLPSTGALRALEALDRLGSATAAADDLNLSQSAVSRQIQALEEQTGVTLVIREGRRMVLTPEAADYAAEIRAALNKITQATLKRDALAGAAPGRVRPPAPGGDDQPVHAAETVQLWRGTL